MRMQESLRVRAREYVGHLLSFLLAVGIIVVFVGAGLALAAPTIQGANIVRTNTDSTFLISSATADSTTSGTVGAITFQATANITDTDLLVDVKDSAGNHPFTCTEAGSGSFGAGLTINVNSAGNLASAATTSAFTILSSRTAASTSASSASVELGTTVALGTGDLLIGYLSGASYAATLDKDGMFRSTTPTLLASPFIGAVTVAGTTYGGDVLPAFAFTVNSATIRTSAAGSGGTTNFVLRISDGSNTCDCTMACNAVAGNKSLTCAGTAGTGCALPASASLSYSVNSIGDCSVGPTVVGNAQVRGYWTP